VSEPVQNPEERLEKIPHPLADRIREGFVHVESRAPVIFLDGARADLLVHAGSVGQRVVFVTDERTGLTSPFEQALSESNGAWVVRSVDGTLRDGLSGRRLDAIADAIEHKRVATAADVAVSFLRPESKSYVELVITSSVRHRAELDTALGGPAEILAERFTGGSPQAWDLHEPADNAWDRAALTAVARDRMPADTRFIARGPGFLATIHVARTSNGLEETTRAFVLVGESGSDAANAAVADVPGALAALNTMGMPLIALALARPARADQLRHPVLPLPPLPIAILLGPPGVRALGLDPVAAVADWDAVVVGRPRIPALLFPLGTLEDPGIDRLRELLESFDSEKLAGVLGINAESYREGTRGS
jgi:hypothetical protein